ncbi:hypothetical protein FRC05_006426 [Tulasnella sp. 425]|nr:hypothetical protein FRC05_006426 [Tulasnella sp. 425]
MRYTEEELTDFYNYDTNLAFRIVAEDEGKPFTRLLVKPAGFNEWLNQDGTVSISSWVSEKKGNREFDVNEIGRKMLKKALFKNVVSGGPSSSSHLRNGFRRALANKATPHPRHFVHPGTPYPKVNNIPLVAGAGGTLQLSAPGNGPVSYSLPDPSNPHAFALPAVAYHGDDLVAENVRLRHQLEDARVREDSTQRSIIRSPEVSNEVGLNMMGFTVPETPLISPSPERIVRMSGDTNMINSY